MAEIIFKNGKFSIDKPLYQWDKNITLRIKGLSLPSTPEIHFSNSTMGGAIVKTATVEDDVVVVTIPNGLLQVINNLKVYVCFYQGEEFTTNYRFILEITPREKPGDYTLQDDEDVYSFNELKALVESYKDQVDGKIQEAKTQIDTDFTVRLDTQRSEIDAEIAIVEAKANAKYETVNERVNNLVVTDPGSTGDNAELLDIRVGSDGKIYPTAGDAVRVQVSELKGDIENKGLNDGSVTNPKIAEKSVSVGKLDFIETLEEEPQTVSAPCRVGKWLTSANSTLENWKSNIDREYFFSTPWFFHNLTEDSEVYNIFTALGGNYMQANEDGLESGKYYFYYPCHVPNTPKLRVLTSSYDSFTDAATNNDYEVLSVASAITVVSHDVFGLSASNYPLSIVMNEFTVPEGKCGFICSPKIVIYNTTKEMKPYFHLSKVPIPDVLNYNELTPTSFSETLKYFYFGETEAGKKLMRGLKKKMGSADDNVNEGTGYPINTYNKTFVIGGDSGTSYGGEVITETIKERTGMVGTVRSVAGSKFTGTESGGGIWFRNQYHDSGYPDVVCLCWGGNFDSGGVGSVKEDYGADDTIPTTTLGALRYIVEDIRTVSPDTLILGWIPYQMNLDESYDSRKVVYDQIREGYKLLGIPIIDAFYESGIVPRDMMSFDGGGIGGDSGHPSSYGYKRIAKLIANTIIRYA